MMKTLKYFALLIIILSCYRCAVWKNSIPSEGGINVAVKNSITDFINTSKLFKADSVFDVMITDTEDRYIISIGGAVNKIYPQFNDTIGSKSEIFPTKFAVYDGKLFYWNDPEQPIEREILDVLSKFKHIDVEWRDREYNIPLNISDGDPRCIYLPPMVIDDGKMGVVYYICKSNYANYKKTGANTIKRHYKEPKLKCND